MSDPTADELEELYRPCRATEKIQRPHYRAPERRLDYLEHDVRLLHTSGYLFTQPEIDRLTQIYHSIHRLLEILKRIPNEDYPYAALPTSTKSPQSS